MRWTSDRIFESRSASRDPICTSVSAWPKIIELGLLCTCEYRIAAGLGSTTRYAGPSAPEHDYAADPPHRSISAIPGLSALEMQIFQCAPGPPSGSTYQCRQGWVFVRGLRVFGEDQGDVVKKFLLFLLLRLPTTFNFRSNLVSPFFSIFLDSLVSENTTCAYSWPPNTASTTAETVMSTQSLSLTNAALD
jgi:hypothetical protein